MITNQVRRAKNLRNALKCQGNALMCCHVTLIAECGLLLD